MKPIALTRLLPCLVLWLANAGAAEPPAVADAWARATPPGATTAAIYANLMSVGRDDALVGAETSAARTVEFHASVTTNGMHHMHELDSIPLAAGALVALSPGGLHIMLVDIAAPLRPGVPVPLTLRFASGTQVALAVPVRDGRDAAATH